MPDGGDANKFIPMTLHGLSRMACNAGIAFASFNSVICRVTRALNNKCGESFRAHFRVTAAVFFILELRPCFPKIHQHSLHHIPKKPFRGGNVFLLSGGFAW